MTDIDPTTLPATQRLLEAIVELWPDHLRYLTQSFAERPPEVLETTERTATLVAQIAQDNLLEYCEEYQFKCRLVQMEELYFRRTGHYRLSTFAEAQKEVYDNPAFMTRYLNGILMTHIFWYNHATAIHTYRTLFLEGNPPGYRHLEVGPGHGLLLYFAASDPACASAEAWDISDASLAATAACMTRFGMADKVLLRRRNLFEERENDPEIYDSIVISEVLEHLEHPATALRLLARRLSPAGRLFVHVPVNGPSPDHIYLLRTPEEAVELVRSAGLEIEVLRIIPGTGYDEARARREGLMLSCVLVATRGIAPEPRIEGQN
ncbi:MAG: class I SAM-dependent methyltransferase [Magnetococcales bacterium]|nr:class I SAM-dependent methyltransferase [Magnetococcales bacterium]